MIAQIPLTADPAQALSVQLGATKYYLEARYNSRNGLWTLDLSDDATRAPLALGLALVLGQDLLEPYNLGIGRLLVVDTSARGKEAGADDLGDRVLLCWASPDEEFA